MSDYNEHYIPPYVGRKVPKITFFFCCLKFLEDPKLTSLVYCKVSQYSIKQNVTQTFRPVKNYLTYSLKRSGGLLELRRGYLRELSSL
jgi:hypothetical protein